MAITLGGAQAWAYRFSPSTPDVVAYLDIADIYLSGNWSDAINGIWSPLYSWLLAIATFTFRPSPYWEYPVVKLVNFIVFLFTVACFELFLKELLLQNKVSTPNSKTVSFIQVSPELVLTFCYGLFLFITLRWTGVFCDTPDMSTAALIYLGSAILLRIGRHEASWPHFIVFGVVLALAYYSKAVMLPLAAVYFVLALLYAQTRRARLAKVLVAAVVFGFLTAPFILALSKKKGYFTYSEAGTLAYAFEVYPASLTIPESNWQGDSAGFGKPKHPTRKILDSPVVFEFGTPIPGTYPPWTDPSYWYDGLQVRFDFVSQAKKLFKNVSFYWDRFLGLLVVAYLLIVAPDQWRASARALLRSSNVILPAIAGLGAYAVATDFLRFGWALQPSTRYIAPFVVLLVAGVIASIRLSDSRKARRTLAVLTAALLLSVTAGLCRHLAIDALNIITSPGHVYWQVSNVARERGIRPGDKLAIVAKGTGSPYLYWARLAKLKIVAETKIDDRDLARHAAITDTVLESSGASVLIAEVCDRSIWNQLSEAGWQQLGRTEYFAYFRHKNETTVARRGTFHRSGNRSVSPRTIGHAPAVDHLPTHPLRQSTLGRL